MKRDALDGDDSPPPKRSRGGAKPSAAPSKRPDDVGSGRIVRFDEQKGYGFIAPDDGQDDIFFLKGELPHELSGATRRDHLVDSLVEFDVEERPDGKLRAHNMVLLSPPPSGCPPPGDDDGPPISGGLRRAHGRILKFDRQKGYGFIQCQSEKQDVFFLSGVISNKELQDHCRAEGAINVEVEVEVEDNEEGKPRAIRVHPAHHQRAPPRHRHEAAEIPRRPGAHIGSFVRFEPAKGFGFIEASDLGDDVFCLRSELPVELRDANHKDEVIGCRVEFELKTMPDGKYRAQKCSLVPPPGMGCSGGITHIGPDGTGHCIGKIRKLDRQKGYGFIEFPGNPDVFFLPSALPTELRNSNENLDGMEVNFVLYTNEEGKPRARDIRRLHGGGGWGGLPPPPGYMGMPMGMPAPMAAMAGMMNMMMGGKGKGGPPVNLWPSPPPPGPLPSRGAPSSGPSRGDRHDGQDRQQRERGSDENQELDRGLVDEMEEYLAGEGGGCDFGKFASVFTKVKKRQLEKHFKIVKLDKRNERIELREGPGSDVEEEQDDLEALPGEEESGIIEEEEEQPAEVEEDGILEEEGDAPESVPGDDVPMDEMAIEPNLACRPSGVIRSYDAARGFGFLKVGGFADDIFFPRSALPEAFRLKRNKQMPELKGVEVTFELGHDKERGPRGVNVHLCLKYHVADRCWLLKRA